MTPDELRSRARERLHDVREVPSLQVEGATPSAVLAPFFFERGELRVWLVRKTKGLRVHSGQVALPGGKVEPHDGTLLDTALREAREEIGLDAALVDVLGAAEPFPTMTGFVVTPFVALLRGSFLPEADRVEIARVFSAPVEAFRVDGTIREVNAGRWKGQVPTYAIDDEIVWGATAHILRWVAGRLFD